MSRPIYDFINHFHTLFDANNRKKDYNFSAEKCFHDRSQNIIFLLKIIVQVLDFTYCTYTWQPCQFSYLATKK